MNSIKVEPETNVKILRFCKIARLSKKKLIEVIITTITDEELGVILARDYEDLIRVNQIDWDNDDMDDDEDDEIDWEEDDDDNEEEDEDDWDEERDTHSEEICKGCGEKNIACRCEDIEAEKYSNYKADCKKRNDEFKNKGLDNEENSGKHVKDVPCRICGETINNCTCKNLDGFDDIGETILE